MSKIVTAGIVAVCTTYATLWVAVVAVQVGIDRALDHFYEKNLYEWD